MFQWLWSKIYNNIMKDAEEKCLREWYRALLKNSSGDVLELGCGTGALICKNATDCHTDIL